MRQKQKTLLRFELFAIVLVGFVFLFGFLGDTLAATCLVSPDGAPGTPAWNTGGNCDYPITFNDPGGSELATCQYQAINWNESIDPNNWSPAVANPDSCTGSTANMKSGDISIGSSGDCTLNGQDTCFLYWKATDQSDNTDDGLLKSFDIDYSPPSGGSISYTDGFTTSTSAVLTVNDGTDAGSGINTATRIVQRKSATLSGGVCGSYGSFATVSVTGTYPSFTNSGLVSGNCYQYRYRVSDNAGNQQTYTSANTVKVDPKFPRLNAFSADRTVLNIANPTVVISFSPPAPEDFGGSGIAQVELWRKKPGGSWASYDTDTPPLGTSFSDTPTDGDGTYEYGIHIVDNASNCITEGANNCATGTPPGDGVTRTVFSPILVQVDKTAPTVTINQAAGQSDPTNSSPVNFSVVFSESVVGFTGSDVAITGTAGGTKTVTITGSGASYNAAVSGMTSGTVIADIPAGGAADSFGNLNAVSTSTDNTVTYSTVAPSVDSNNHSSWKTSNISVTITPNDEGGTAIVETRFNWDSNFTDTTCTATGGGTAGTSTTLSDEGSHILYMCTRNQVGLTGTRNRTYLLDKTDPSVSANNASSSWFSSRTATLSGSDSGGSGFAQGRYSWDSNPMDGSCTTGGTPFTNGTVLSVSAGSHRLYLCGRDGAGRTDTWDSGADKYRVDATAPIVNSFSVGGISYPSTLYPNSSFNIAWSSTDSGGSGIQKHEIWRAPDSGGNPGTWTRRFDNATSPQSDDPADGTWWYGVHTLDNASNCITEAGTHCGGVSSDGSDPRTVRGPIKVVMLHNQPPSMSSVSDSPDPIKANADITFTAQWNDDDGDSVTFFVCKNTSTPTGGDCSGGAANRWCRNTTSVAPGTDATCNPTYTTQAVDEGTSPNAYYAFVCDANACSSSKSGSFTVDNTIPTVVINLQNSGGSTITKVNEEGQPGDTLYIHVGDSTDNIAIAEVQFANDDTQDGIPQGVWTSWEQWSVSQGDWNAATKRQAWRFSTSGNKEVWVGLKDTVGNTAQGYANFYVNVTPVSTLYRWNGAAYVCDQDDCPEKLADNWKKGNFTRYIFDQDTDGTLSSCSWLTGTMGEVPRTPCANASFNQLLVTVGSSGACSTQGASQCVVYVRNTDNDQALAPYGIATYNADWFPPDIQNNPAFVDSGTSQTFSTTVSDNTELNYCWLYDSYGAGMAYGAEFYADTCYEGSQLSACPGEADCKACVGNLDFAVLDNHPLQVICSDHWDIENSAYLNTTSLGISSVFVQLDSIPPQGSTSTQFKLKATVSGTMTGTINYKFDCEDDGVWELEVNNESQTAYTTGKICQYPTTGLKTARVLVERGVGEAQDTVQITVAPNAKPEAINLQVFEDSYCFVPAPPIVLSWTFYDEDPGDVQTAYQVQIGAIDTGKVQSSNSEYAPIGLSYDTTYSWRVKVWDALDDASAWANGTPFTTPVHAYPAPDFTWGPPQFPSAEEEVPFTDQTSFALGSTGQSWLWDFGDTGTSALQSPTHVYTENGVYPVILQATDDAGTCQIQKDVNVTLPFPDWQEISPF